MRTQLHFPNPTAFNKRGYHHVDDDACYRACECILARAFAVSAISLMLAWASYRLSIGSFARPMVGRGAEPESRLIAGRG